jgi:hypothetical protein
MPTAGRHRMPDYPPITLTLSLGEDRTGTLQHGAQQIAVSGWRKVGERVWEFEVPIDQPWLDLLARIYARVKA